MEFKLRINSTLEPNLERLIQRVIGLAFDVHKNFGPGYIETIYEKALCYEFDKAGIRYLRQIEILVPYKDAMLSGQRLDLLVEKKLILEIKAVEQTNYIHHAKMISYMR